MAVEFFTTERGLSVESTFQVIGGADAPGVSGDSLVVDLGSLYLRNQAGNIRVYQRSNNLGNTADWTEIGAATTDVSWREPVQVLDAITTTLPTGTPTNTITVDGETVADGGRVLFSALTVSPNVYIYDQALGTFAQDTNLATDGDRVYIQTGTSAGQERTFNNVGNWVQTNDIASALTEIAAIQGYAGKPGDGAIFPQYTSTNEVVNNDPLNTAISKLDAAMGPDLSLGTFVTAGQNTRPAIQALDAELGDARTRITATGVSTSTVVDSFLVDTFAYAHYFIRANSGALTQAYHLWATHDGTTGADATTARHTRFGVLSIGAIAGLTVNSQLSGAGAAQVVEIVVNAGVATDFLIERAAVRF